MPLRRVGTKTVVLWLFQLKQWFFIDQSGPFLVTNGPNSDKTVKTVKTTTFRLFSVKSVKTTTFRHFPENPTLRKTEKREKTMKLWYFS